jgi:heptosyltransferase-2
MFIGEALHKIKNKFIKKSLRGIKHGYFAGVDFLGGIIFWIARLLRLIPAREIFSKDKVKNILVIRIDRIGDVLLSTPVVRALRENFPESFIGFLVAPYTEKLLLANPDIDEVVVYDRLAPLRQKLEFLKRLRGYKFDLVIILYPVFESGLIAYLSGASFRIGYPLNGSGFLLTQKADIKNLYKHEIETCLDVVRTIGADTLNKRPSLLIEQEAERYAGDFFINNGILPSDLVAGIHPGGFKAYTHWSREGYARVADALIGNFGAKVILLGSPLDKDTLDSVLRLMQYKPVILDPAVSLQQLAALIKRCNIFLGNNSGPMHIAAALGVPVVAIFGNIHPLDSENKWAPYGEGHIIVRKQMDCPDCHPGHCYNHRCIEMVSVGDVLSAIEIQIAKIRRQNQ